MKLKSLYSRIALTFAFLILLFGGFCATLDYYAAKNYQQEIIQQLSRGLAEHIAGHWPLSKAKELDNKAVSELFHMLMVVNPSIEVYLLDPNGAILAYKAPPGKIKQQKVSLEPIKAFLDGAELPLKGDNPRNPEQPEIFSVTTLQNNDKTSGYLYIVLTGDNYQVLAENVRQGHVFKTAAWTTGLGLALTLVVGLGLFAVLTRRLNALTCTVTAFEELNFDGSLHMCPKIAASSDEIGQLARAFEHMAERISNQMRHIKAQDEQRREMVANVSHDLRTPLTSMQGYLETLLRKSQTLTDSERQHYLQVAVRQSQRVSHLANELFELAKLECEEVRPNFEPFFIQELIQDVAQKFELSAVERNVRLTHQFPEKLPMVNADIAMIDRVLTNLIDNALRHTQAGGSIRLDLSQSSEECIRVDVSDTGVGIDEEHLNSLFDRNSPLRHHQFGNSHGGAGLGLLISKRILELHASSITAFSSDSGAVFTFTLPVKAGSPETA